MGYSSLLNLNNSQSTVSEQSASSAFKMLINAWHDYEITKETEKTKRAAINAWKEVSIGRIDSQRQILEQYLILAFKERAFTINELFYRLDKGINENNSLLISAAIGAIVDIAKESPLKKLQTLCKL